MNPLFQVEVNITPSQYATLSTKIKLHTGITLNNVKGEARYKGYIFKYIYDNTVLIIDCLACPKFVSILALGKKIVEVLSPYTG